MNRLENMSQVLDREKLDALLVKKSVNQRYLEGFTGNDCFMMASAKGNFLIADSRYTEMAASECRSARICPHRAPHPPLAEVVASIAKDNGFTRIGFEKHAFSWAEYADILSQVEKAGAELIPSGGLVEEIRAEKTPEEAAMIGQACQIADRALTDALPLIMPGVSELDIKRELDYLMQRGGADGSSFDTMVLFGARASQPHANSRRDVYLKPGDFILIDYGACKNGYRSDTTRTFVCGEASEEQRRAYDTVLASQIAALNAVRAGANGKMLNQIAIDILEKAGYERFTYGLGHGVGLEIHEEPFMRQGTDKILTENSVVTIEPGVYIPGWGGIRIEDTVVVTDTGCRILTDFPKELIEL